MNVPIVNKAGNAIAMANAIVSELAYGLVRRYAPNGTTMLNTKLGMNFFMAHRNRRSRRRRAVDRHSERPGAQPHCIGSRGGTPLPESYASLHRRQRQT